MITDIKIGITGLPGSGKTYALLRVIEMVKEEEISIGGMVDEPIEEDRKKKKDVKLKKLLNNKD